MRAAEYASLEAKVLEFMRGGAGTFEALATEIHGFQFQHNEPYRKYAIYCGKSDSLQDWEEIPAVPQQAFKMSRLATFPPEPTIREFRTSGTTGEGFGTHYFASTRLYEETIEQGWEHARLPRFPAFLLTPPPAESPHSSLSFMLDRLAGGDQTRSYFRSGKLEAARLREDLAVSKRPVMVLGTALAFLNLVENEIENLPLPAGSVVMETGGYKGSGRLLTKTELYDRLAPFFCVPLSSLINEYGMTELSSQYYTSGLDQPHRAGRWIRHRVIDPANGRKVQIGESGMLQFFDLANLGSVLGIQTEDLAIEQGDGFVLLGRDPAATARGCSRSADEVLQR